MDDYKKEDSRRILFRYLAVSLFCFILSRIYLYYSHSATSPWMTFLFAWPLILGGVPAALRLGGALSGKRAAAASDLYRFGIAAVTVGSLLRGILEIAGTDSDYPGFLLWAGAAMLVAGALLWLRPVTK